MAPKLDIISVQIQDIRLLMTVLYWLIVSVCTADLCITCRLLAATHILALVAVCLQEVSPQYRSVCVVLM